MPQSPISPSVRAELLASMTSTCSAWMRELMKGYFDNPSEPFAQQLMLEAFAGALAEMARHTPQGLAIVQTFILELQESVEPKEPTK